MEKVYVVLKTESGINEVIGVVNTDDTDSINFRDVNEAVEQYHGAWPILSGGDKIVLEVEN